MRLHHLGMTAFGPFAGSEQIDFDELSEAGLFLLTGPTGGGKTTILDAVCFALYGSVPGARGVKALKSQHAPSDRRPEVVLDFSVRDRRFVLRRSPEWRRPKRRGDGFTTENASATLLEVVHGDEQLLSSRAQEVGHFIGELVGMQSTQFVQVAMLPQGEFQKFLRATSQDRHDVLQHLFRTDRYARIEEWVQDHSRSLREHADAGRADVVRALDALADRAGCEVPPDLSADGLDLDGVSARAETWADALLEGSAEAAGRAGDQHSAAQQALGEARQRHDAAVRVHELVARRDQAAAELAALEADADAVAETRSRLDADDRVGRCLPLLRMLDDATAERTTATATWHDHAEALAALDVRPFDLPDPVSAETLTELERRTRSRASRLEALLPRERELTEVTRALADDTDALVEARERLREAAGQREQVPSAQTAAQERLTAAVAGTARLDGLTAELDQARRQAAAARRAEECRRELDQLRDSEREARDRAADARERVQELTARRLAGIAAELAGRLAPGEACQVCGSTEHPAPAATSADAVTEDEQTRADEAHHAATTTHADARGKVVQMQERLDGLHTAAAGLDAAQSAARVASLEEAVAEAAHASADEIEAAALVQDLQEQADRLSTAVQDLTTTVATLDQSVTAARRTVDSLRSELVEALGGTPGEEPGEDQDHVGSLADEIDRMRRSATTVHEAQVALIERDAAARRHDELAVRLAAAAAEHGFAGVEELRAAALTDQERTRLTALLESRERSAARARSVLAEEAVLDLGDEEAPDLAGVRAELRTAEEAEAAAARVRHAHEDARDALTRHRARLDQALASWTPVREEHLRADAMAKLVRGMGADNQLQMRLSAYVLATRLDQVVAAANERLAHMRDQRYLLQRTGRAARRGAQAGLGLEVVDQWTGDVRDPATLSGGETFVVSLALALGLADVVTQEAGGTEIETLFVDEGFGSLDPDTLDDVMDRLDDLRSGGRAVGVVSHVSELRNRIPTQLHVDKGRNGSVVAVRTAVG